jgi:hypothetical protein
MRPAVLRAVRANRVFCTDMKRIRTENTVSDNGNNGFGLLLSKIVDCARMIFIRAQSTIRADGFAFAQNPGFTAGRVRFKPPRILIAVELA